MNRTAIILILCLASFGSISQNIIQNSTNWTDTNGDGLADNWYTGPFVTETSVGNGVQYIATTGTNMCQQIRLGQVLDLHEVAGKYTISFDMVSDCMVQLCAFWNSGNGYLITTIAGGSPQHYEFTFAYGNDTFYAIEFITVSGHSAWLRIDNVVLTDGNNVLTGVPSIVSDERRMDSGIYDLLGRRLAIEPENGIYIKNGKKFIKIKR
jgi:hypothetical protein